MRFDTESLIFDKRKSDLVFDNTFNNKILSPGINFIKLQVSCQSVTKQYYFWVFVCFTVYFNVCFLLLDE